jgi:hypothetical protein
MESSPSHAQSGRMKHFMLIAGILGAGLAAHARDKKPADVTVYVEGSTPGPVYLTARATVTRMFARIGVRVVWHDGVQAQDPRSPGPLTVQVEFADREQSDVSKEALARALPFDDHSGAITVMYDRIQFIANGSSREAPLLAHVLAHELGHVLERTDAHSVAGVMKAHWDGQDLETMERKPLDFTSGDVAMIRDGLSLRVARLDAVDRDAPGFRQYGDFRWPGAFHDPSEER